MQDHNQIAMPLAVNPEFSKHRRLVKKTISKEKMLGAYHGLSNSCMKEMLPVLVRILNVNLSSMHHCRKRYPKTNVPLPVAVAPFKSVFSTYSWADVWIQKVSQRYGQAWLMSRLKHWKWNLTTAFSGCGAAESAT